ncbi:MAG TPA: diguanylate cyclase [Methylothermaceae bacterium]|nr:diguanylate cyclase [Methylothermaceae bacterium]
MIVTLDDLSVALDKAPLAVLVLQGERVAWLNQTLADLTRRPKGALIGQPLTETPLVQWQEEVVEVAAEDGHRWFQRQHIQPLEHGEAHYFLDITEQRSLKEMIETLQNRLQTLETRDPVTGLQNRRAILRELDRQISRSRRYNNPLAVIRLTLDINSDTARQRQLLRNISQTLKDKLRWADEIGMLDDHTFLLVLPETSLEDAKELAVKLLSDRAAFQFKDGEGKVRYGVAGWNKGDDLRKLLRRVEQDQEINLSALLS